MCVSVCFHLASISHLHINLGLNARLPDTKSRHLIISTGCVSHPSSFSISPRPFVLMSFSYDIQTSSCVEPLHPVLCPIRRHRRQEPDSGGGGGGGGSFGPWTFLSRANKQLLFSGLYSVLQRSRGICWDASSSISGAGGGRGVAECERLENRAAVPQPSGSNRLRRSAISEHQCIEGQEVLFPR